MKCDTCGAEFTQFLAGVQSECGECTIQTWHTKGCAATANYIYRKLEHTLSSKSRRVRLARIFNGTSEEIAVKQIKAVQDATGLALEECVNLVELCRPKKRRCGMS